MKLPMPGDVNGVPYIGNLDTAGNITVPTEQYILNAGVYQPISTSNPLPITVGSGAMQSLTAATPVGVGTNFNLVNTHQTFGLQVSFTGAPTTCVVNIEGSLNGTNYFKLGSYSIPTNNSGDIVFVTGTPVTQIRANLTTLTGGTSPTVSAWLSAY